MTAIQALAGHQELSMTQRYMHVSPAALDEAIRLLDSPQWLRFWRLLETGGGSRAEGQWLEQLNWR